MTTISSLRGSDGGWPALSFTNPTHLRRQRQDAVRRQCSNTHLREIRALVARMVESGEQCYVCNSSARISNEGMINDLALGDNDDLPMAVDGGDLGEEDEKNDSYPDDNDDDDDDDGKYEDDCPQLPPDGLIVAHDVRLPPSSRLGNGISKHERLASVLSRRVRLSSNPGPRRRE